ncbi:DUF5133 domain-containing protein [Streptomyces sp. NPDC059740]|uniref:DUF5133 domain-containing protein n=1 Tax=Streptomyces sp. NPDC059740 TaxID=3346926 RepID=UPI00365C6820
MLRAHPAVLRRLLRRYETLLARTTDAAGGEGVLRARRDLQDTAYTLCVITGTRSIEEALGAARRQLEEGPREAA